MGGSWSFSDLVELIARLRDPADGCPWDRAQDHVSLRPYVLEEAYETIAAIDAGDPDALASELGDVLLQVLLHTRIASERGDFSIEDVMAHLGEKLTRRHHHVFADASNDLPSIYRRWDEIKSREKRVEATLPILVAARKAVIALMKRERTDLIDEVESGPTPEERAGARLLRVIEELWREGLDPELALRKALARLAERVGE